MNTFETQLPQQFGDRSLDGAVQRIESEANVKRNDFFHGGGWGRLRLRSQIVLLRRYSR